MGDSEAQFTVTLDDGRIARCWRACRQEYRNAEFSAGLVKDLEPETVYLAMDRDGQEVFFFFRTDEALAVQYVLAGALWSRQMVEMEDERAGTSFLEGIA